MHAQHGMKPMLACVMSLTDKRAAARAVPGVVITDTMRELLARSRTSPRPLRPDAASSAWPCRSWACG